MAAQNRTLGRFELTDIPPAPRGVPQIEVTFDIDANGIVHVSAKDLGTGKEQKIRIEASSGLSEAEIQRMVKEAESHAAEDKAFRERTQAKNEADNLIYSIEKSMKELGNKVPDAEKDKVNSAISDLRKAINSDNLNEIKAKMETLKQASHKIAEMVYAQAQGQQSNSEQANSSQQAKTEKPVEDADYEIVDDDEKK